MMNEQLRPTPPYSEYPRRPVGTWRYKTSVSDGWGNSAFGNPQGSNGSTDYHSGIGAEVRDTHEHAYPLSAEYALFRIVLIQTAVM